MSYISKILAILSVIFITFLANVAYSENEKVDPRLADFLAFVIKDQKALNAEKEVYAKNKITFEQFITVVFTGKIKLDNTPDNSHALAQLGGYLEKKRPFIAVKLLEPLETFNAKKENETVMRTMLLATIKGIVDEQN